MVEQIRRIEPEKSASNKGVANLTLAPWQCNSQMNTIWVVMTTSILIIGSREYRSPRRQEQKIPPMRHGDSLMQSVDSGHENRPLSDRRI